MAPSNEYLLRLDHPAINTDSSVAAPTAKKNNTPESKSTATMLCPMGRTASARKTGMTNTSGAKSRLKLVVATEAGTSPAGSVWRLQISAPASLKFPLCTAILGPHGRRGSAGRQRLRGTCPDGKQLFFGFRIYELRFTSLTTDDPNGHGWGPRNTRNTRRGSSG